MGLGLVLIASGLCIVVGLATVLCQLARWVIGPGYEAAGPLAVVILGAAWLVGAVWRD